jgi:hypothetical protein
VAFQMELRLASYIVKDMDPSQNIGSYPSDFISSPSDPK